MKVRLSTILPGQASEACCTCASVLSEVPSHSPQTEKPYPAARVVECCSRVICGRCIHGNPRFASYCPYCQIASEPSNPLPQGLREPPSYDTATTTSDNTKIPADAEAPPPPYTASSSEPQQPGLQDSKKAEAGGESSTTTTNNIPNPPPPPPPPDTLHFVHPSEDTIPSLSLRYGVPAQVLRRHNRLTSDHLLSARRTVLIPGSYYPSGVSLRPRPAEGEEEEARRAKIRRWMVGCKCADYDVAELYLGQSGYDLDAAVGRFLDDERWEREHPLEAAGGKEGKGKGKGKGSKMGTGGTWAAQAAFLRRQRPSS